MLLAPAVVPDGTFGLVSFRGIAGGNAFLTDGNDTTEQYYNENAGRTRIQSQIGQDAVQEFQVVSNNYSAEFGHAMGGVVNTVTRSGIERFPRHRRTGSSATRISTPPTLSVPSIPPPASASTRSKSATSSAPAPAASIIKDKLFYFANYEGLRRDFPLIASMTASGQSALQYQRARSSAPAALPPPPAQCDAAQDLPATASSRPCPAR